jgi:peptidyl-prolyl cis-trans isomerase-like 2
MGIKSRALTFYDQAKKAATTDISKQNPSGPKPAIPYNAAHFSTGAAAASFTSTAATPVTSNTRALIDEEEFMFKQIKKKGYVRLVTNLGNLNLELFCDEVSKNLDLNLTGYNASNSR